MANDVHTHMANYRRRPTNKVMPVGMNYLSDLVVRPHMKKRMVPLLMYRGQMNPGHALRLWNMVLLMFAAEAETLSDGLKIVNNPAFSQLCGPFNKPGKPTLFGYFGRLLDNPEVTRNIPGLTDYVKSLELGPCWLTPVDIETARARCAPWRVSTHEEPGKEAQERGIPRAQQGFYPYLAHNSERPDDGKELMKLVHSVVPREFPDHIRADICQEMIVSVLSGEVSRDNLHDHVRKHIRKVFKVNPTKYNEGEGATGIRLSLDAKLTFGLDDDRTLHDHLHDGSYDHWADLMPEEEDA